MVTIRQGDIWWADLGEPRGSAAGLRRPVLVVQGDSLNRSRIATVVCVPLTSNPHWAHAPGNVTLSGKETDLPNESVANVSQILTLDKTTLDDRVGRISARKLTLVFAGIDIILGRR